MRNKKGISLIVLVITIIVMIILAASVVITLSNSGIINKANDAVNATNLKEVQNLAQLLWSEAYMEGKRTVTDIQTYIDGKLDSDIKAKYDVVASEVGVTVTLAVDPTGIEVADGTVAVNGTLDLATKVTYAPEGARNKPLTWEITEGSDYATITNGVLTGTAAGTVTVKATITGTSINDTATITVEAAPTLASASTSYVGYYADIDGKDGIDGVIYADLLAGSASGKWSDTNTSEYNYSTLADYTALKEDPTKAKTYVVSAETVTDDFGTKNVIKLATNNTGTIDRFYVMALNDVSSTSYYWYKNAYSYMNPSDTSKAFGAGKTNTTTMLNLWKAGMPKKGENVTAVEPDSNDMWGNLGANSTNSGWFVPSFQEWTAFAVLVEALETSLGTTYSAMGLKNYYWSSSQYSTNGSWYADFSIGCMRNFLVNLTYFVRLSVTF